MKKLLALLLAIVMILSLVACGEKKDDDDDDKGNDKPKTENPKDPVDPTDAPIVTPVEGETLEANLFTLIYDAEEWSYDEEEHFYDDEDYSKISLYVPEDEESYLINVQIRVSIEDHEGFREDLAEYGFDAYEYVVNDAYDLVNVGGVDCLVYEGESWGEDFVRYLSRDEAASATIWVDVYGACEDSRVSALLEGLTVTVEDTGNEDAPWPWDGEPFSASDNSAMAGTLTVSSQWIPITDCIVTMETFEHAVAVSGDQAYLLVDGVLKQHKFDGESLVYEKDIEMDGEYSSIQATTDGTVWISAFMEPLVSLNGGVQTGSYDGPDEVSMHPSGAWGISWFSGPECEKITLSGGTMSTTEITFSEVSTISTLIVDEDYIYVCGYAADDSGHKVFVYDENGALQMEMTDADGEALGSISFIAKTATGFIGLDGNMRDVILWTADGTYIGSIEDSDLFDTYYPWFCAGAVLSDGSILVLMTEDRADESAMELVAFKLSVQ